MLVKRDEQSFEALSRVLSSGNVVVMACDTIYGFVGKVPDTEGLIRRIKGRGERKPFLQLISDSSELNSLGVVSPDSDILNLWPGPFTFIFSLKSGATIGYRVPEDERLRQLIRKVGSPLFSTSVNRAGESPMNDPATIQKRFGGDVTLVEDSGLYSGRHPSTVVDLSVHPHRILRQGAGEVPSRYL